MEMVQETYDCIDEIEAPFGGIARTAAVRQCDHLFVRRIAERTRSIGRSGRTFFGIPNERIDRRRLKELLPWMEVSAVEEALYMPTDAFIDCALLCSGYARAARSLGAELRPNTKVKAIVAVGDKATEWSWRTGKKVLAPVVVNAAGSWANLLMRPLGVGLPLLRYGVIFGLREQTPGVFPANHPLR